MTNPVKCARCERELHGVDDEYAWTHKDEKKTVCGECFDALYHGGDDFDDDEVEDDKVEQKTVAITVEDGQIQVQAVVPLPKSNDESAFMRALEYCEQHGDDEAADCIEDFENVATDRSMKVVELEKTLATMSANLDFQTKRVAELEERFGLKRGSDKPAEMLEDLTAKDEGYPLRRAIRERLAAQGPIEKILDEHDGQTDLRAVITLPDGFMVEVAIEDATGAAPEVAVYAGTASDPGSLIPDDQIARWTVKALALGLIEKESR